jgi:hypothetical protein
VFVPKFTFAKIPALLLEIPATPHLILISSPELSKSAKNPHSFDHVPLS